MYDNKCYRWIKIYGDNSKYEFVSSLLHDVKYQYLVASRIANKDFRIMYGKEAAYCDEASQNIYFSSDMPQGIVIDIPPFNVTQDNMSGKYRDNDADILIFSAFPYDKDELWNMADFLISSGKDNFKVIFWDDERQLGATDAAIDGSSGSLSSAIQKAEDYGFDFCVVNSRKDILLSILAQRIDFADRCQDDFRRWLKRQEKKVKSFSDNYAINADILRLGSILDILETDSERELKDFFKYSSEMERISVWQVLCSRYKRNVMPQLCEAAHLVCDIGIDCFDREAGLFYHEIDKLIDNSFKSYFAPSQARYDCPIANEAEYHIKNFDPEFKRKARLFVEKELKQVLYKYLKDKFIAIKKSVEV